MLRYIMYKYICLFFYINKGGKCLILSSRIHGPLQPTLTFLLTKSTSVLNLSLYLHSFNVLFSRGDTSY